MQPHPYTPRRTMNPLRKSGVLRGAACCMLGLGLLVLVPPVLAEQTKKPTPEPKLTIVTASAHCDWTWAHSRQWHEDRYAQIIHDVLLLMRKYPRYVWQLENENEELSAFLKKAKVQWPEMIDEFWNRVREGRIEVIVAISDPRLNEVYPETTVRNLVLGKQYFRRHAPGIKQPAYHAVDLMVGHSQMPQILAKAEYKYFMFSRPAAKKAVFWRTGLDGTRILCALQHYSLEGAVAGGVCLQSNSNDDILPSEGLAKAAETWDPAKRIMATSARYFEEVEKAGDQVPELHGVLDSLESFCCGTGLLGNRNLYTLNNQHEDLLLNVEKARAMAAMAGTMCAKPATDALWHDLLSCVGHAILWSWKPDYEERFQKVQQTRAAGQKALDEALAAVARGIQFRQEAGSPLVVFNFQAWPVSGPVEFAFEGDPNGLELRDSSGRPIQSQWIEDGPAGTCRLAFVAEEVPACGYRTYYLAQADRGGPARPAVQQGLGPVDNGLCRLEMDAQGRIRAGDVKRGATMGAPDAGSLGDVVFYDTPRPADWMMNGPLGRRHDWLAQPEAFRSVQGSVFASLRATGTIGPHVIRREVRLWAKSPRIEYSIEIDAKDGCGIFFVRCSLPVAGRVYAGIPFGAEPRENLAQEPFRGEMFALGYPEAYCATRWTDVSSDRSGYTFIAPHGMHNGYQYRAKERALEFALLRVRPMPQGVWAQVHPWLQGTGTHRWRCALVPHQRTWREAATYRDALECHVPLLAYSPAVGVGRASLARAPVVASAAGKDVASFAHVSPADVVLSSLRCVGPVQERGSPVLEIRLYETLGQKTDAVIRLAAPVQSVQETNFLGEPTSELGKVEAAGREIRLEVPPWKIATLRVTLGRMAD